MFEADGPGCGPVYTIVSNLMGTHRKATLWILAMAAVAAQDPDEAHRKVYRKAAPSVVALWSKVLGGDRSASGVVLSKDGLILTSYAGCPDGATDIRVWLHGPRKLAGELVATYPRFELSLVRVRTEEELVPVEFGRSGDVRVGDRSYTIGNAANSIVTDAEPSFNVGVVSGMYRLDEPRANSTYTGPVLETTAAVNVGMEGAPCLDASGRMIGFVTLNYSPSRFLGTALPIDDVRHILERMRAEVAAAKAPPAEAGRGSLGMTTEAAGGKLVVARVVPGGAADRAGLRKGDVILEVAGTPVRTPADVAARLEGLQAGSIVWVTLDFGGTPERVKVELREGR